MAVKKRTTPPKAVSGTKRPRKSAQPPRRSRLKRYLLTALLLSGGALLALGSTYYFGSFATRAKLNQAAMCCLNTLRTSAWTPRPVACVFDELYDAVPSSEGFIVESGELGRSGSPFLAGIPQSRKALRLLKNKSYINLYDETERQSRCIAFRIGDTPHEQATPPETYYEDPRVKPVRASEMALPEWLPTPIAPDEALAGEFGTEGASETHLTTNLAPMPKRFAEGIWQDAMRTVAKDYPKRFGEVWVYVGPAYRKESSKLASGIPMPDAFYIIAFDLTDSGGLRAISFLIPTDSSPKTRLGDCLSSIRQIEQLTGLRFLPEVGFDVRDALSTWISPNLW